MPFKSNFYWSLPSGVPSEGYTKGLLSLKWSHLHYISWRDLSFTSKHEGVAVTNIWGIAVTLPQICVYTDFSPVVSASNTHKCHNILFPYRCYMNVSSKCVLTWVILISRGTRCIKCVHGLYLCSWTTANGQFGCTKIVFAANTAAYFLLP